MNSTCLAFRMTCYVWPGKWISSKHSSINALLRRQGIWVSFSASDNFQSNFLGGVTYGILTQSRFTIYVPRMLSQKKTEAVTILEWSFPPTISGWSSLHADLTWNRYFQNCFWLTQLNLFLIAICSEQVFTHFLYKWVPHKREPLMELWIYQWHWGFSQFWSNINLWTSYLS